MSACAIAGLALAHAVPCKADVENLLANGTFTADLSGWQTPGAGAWAPFDFDAAPGSGSAYGSNANAGANTRPVALRQCVPITQRGEYLLGASAYVAATPVHGSLVAGAIAHVSTDCSGGGNSMGFFMPSVGAWQSYSGGIYHGFIPGSMEVVLSVDKTDAGQSYAGYFDTVYLIDDTLFIGDFE